MLSRRDLLRTGAGAAATALAVPGLDLAATARAATRTADHRLGFRSLRDEVSLARLPQTGALPDWLTGTLVRNGPALFEIGEQAFNHWFDGLAMLHAFTFRSGRVAYANRYLRSSAHAAWKRHGEIRYSEFGTDPCRSIFNGAAAMYVPAPVPNANVNVVRLAERFVALTEIPIPVDVDPRTLRTLGQPGEAPLGTTETAHPHLDGDRVFSFRTRMAPPAGYVVLRDGEPLAEIPEAKPSYIHSFALTRRYAVLADWPFAMDPLEVLSGWRPVVELFRWDGEARPSRFFVVDRATGRLVARLEAPPFFAFHHVNAFERDGRIEVDVCAYRDAEVVDALYLKRLRSADPRMPPVELRRYTLDLQRGRVTSRVLSPSVLELPRVHPDRDGRPYRYAYGVSMRDRRRSRFIDALAKVDVERGAERRWAQPGCYPGEPVFVPAPHARAEDDGVVLSVVLDARARTSFLLVLDGRTFAERARATVPHHIPFGFHGALV